MSADLELLECLTHSLRPEPQLREPAERFLADRANASGFLTRLLALATSRAEMDAGVRELAVICFKNCAIKRWPQRNPPIDECEKTQLRAGLLQAIATVPAKLAQQLMIAVARIARQDWPDSWPDLMPQLLTALQQSTSSEQMLLVCQTLHSVLKMLVSKKLKKDREQLQLHSAEWFNTVYGVWSTHYAALCAQLVQLAPAPDAKAEAAAAMGAATAAAVEGAAAAASGLATAADASIRGLKILVLLLVELEAGGSPTGALAVQQVVQALVQTRQFCISARIRGGEAARTGDRLLGGLASSLLKLQDRPALLEPHLEIVLPLVLEHLRDIGGTRSSAGDGATRAAQAGLKLLVEILRCGEYGGSYGSAAALPRGRQVLAAWVAEQRVQEMVQLVVGQFLLLQRDELETMQCEPETFFLEQQTSHWKCGLRPGAESLLVALIDQCTLPTLRAVLDLLNQSATTPLVPDQDRMPTVMRLEAIRIVKLKDACYSALALAAHELDQAAEQSSFDYPTWLSNTLVPEMRASGGTGLAAMVLQRRCLVLLGAFAADLTPQLRPEIYAHVCGILLPHNPMLLRLEGSSALMQLLCAPEFEATEMAPHAASALEGLFGLIGECECSENVVAAVDLVSTLLAMLGDCAIPAAAAILPQVPRLWESTTSNTSGSLGALKAAVMRVVLQLVRLCPSCPALAAVVVPIVRCVFEEPTTGEEHLEEEGFSLWHAALSSGLREAPGLLELFSRLILLLEAGADNLEVVLRVCNMYVHQWGAQLIVSPQGQQLVGWLASQLSFDKLRDKGMLLVADTCIVALQRLDGSSIGGLEPVLSAAASILADADTGKRSRVVLTAVSCLMARAWLTAGEHLGAVLSAQQPQQAIESMATALVQHGERADGLLQHRLISCAVLSMLPSMGAGTINWVVPRVVQLAAAAHTELSGGRSASDIGRDFLVARGEPDDLCCSITNSEGGGAGHELMMDPLISTLDVRSVAMEQLGRAGAVHGESTLRQAVSTAAAAATQLGWG